MVSCLYLEFNVWAERGIVVANGTGWDKLFAGFGDYCVEMFDG